MNDPNTNPDNNDVYVDIYNGNDTIILYDTDQEQHVIVKDGTEDG